MQPTYHIKREDHISFESEALEAVLFDGINKEATLKKGMQPISPFGICILDEAGSIIGGVKGVSYYGCLYVDILWIDSYLRYQGWGTKLMNEAERVAKERKCTFMTVNTMDWEAQGFYQKLGFFIEFTREGYDKSSKMFQLRKNL